MVISLCTNQVGLSISNSEFL